MRKGKASRALYVVCNSTKKDFFFKAYTTSLGHQIARKKDDGINVSSYHEFGVEKGFARKIKMMQVLPHIMEVV